MHEIDGKSLWLALMAEKDAAGKLKKVSWGELSKISPGGYDGFQKCWKCGEGFKSKKSWKVWPQGPTCLDCRMVLEVAAQKGYSGGSQKSTFKAAGPKQAPMKNGEVRKLSSGTSALWTEQWLVMGTAKAPYVVSKKQKTGEWQCSCPDWTKHTPRVDCKHILKVKLTEGVPLAPPKDANIFEPKKPTVGNQGAALPAPKGRKFR